MILMFIQAIHEHRRIQNFGSKDEQKKLARRYNNECNFQLDMKQSRLKEEVKRDTFETERCQDLF